MEDAKHTAGAKLGKRALLADCLAKIKAATSPLEVEEAFQQGLGRLKGAYGSYFSSGYRRASEKLRWEGANARAIELADMLPEGRFLPRIGPRRKLTIGGATYSVGYGGNSTGERYAWCAAKEWTRERLRAGGVPDPTITQVLDWWGWPHRALCILANVDFRAAIAKDAPR